MNKEAILLHLREAKDELDRTLGELETDTEYEFGDSIVSMGHLYHHLNTAWHGQDASEEGQRNCARQDFVAWRKFPTNAELFLE